MIIKELHRALPRLFFVVLVLLVIVGLPHAKISADSFRDKLNLCQDPEAVLANILARDEFKESLLDSLIDRIREGLSFLWRKIVAWLGDRFPELGPTGITGEWFLWALGIFAAAGLLLALVLAVARLVGFIGRRAKRTGTEHSPEGDLSEDARDLRQQAQRLAEQGDFRKALMFLFRFVLLQLGDAERIHWHPCWTNREILRRIGKDNPVRETLEQMVAVFNGICYGNDKCGRPEFESFLALAERATGRF